MAGGGTGATTMVMAEQLNHTNSEIVYLDFSVSSMKVALTRAKVRELRNILWISEGIENINRLNLPKFDFMQCSGVLHHLKSPIAGLKVLKDSLKLEGGIDLMVYGTYGRIGVYHMQDMLQRMNLETGNILDELKTAKITLQR
jgi:ubiquinone/menaquinone biosynthesis C-methylase UbiE